MARSPRSKGSGRGTPMRRGMRVDSPGCRLCNAAQERSLSAAGVDWRTGSRQARHPGMVSPTMVGARKR
jgi:hypothetical protein